MSYKRITIASGTPVTDESIDYMKNTNMPAVGEMGATDYEVVQTGPESVIIIATYPDKAAADAAAAKAAELREAAQAQEQFKGVGQEVHEGEVIVTM